MGNLAVAKYLDLRGAGKASRHYVCRSDGGTGLEDSFEVADINRLINNAKTGIAESATVGQSPDKWCLPAFEPRGNASMGARLLALRAAPGRLVPRSAMAACNALSPSICAGRPV
jgi:hypothetical protein